MRRNYVKTAFFAAGAVLVSLSMVSCGPKKQEKKAPEEAEVVYAVSGMRTKEGNLDSYLEFGGDVSSLSAVDVFPDVAGKISRILVNVGDYVKKNQVIAYVDPSRPGMNYSANPVKAPISGRVTSLTPTVGTMISQGSSVAQISTTDDLQVKINVAERFISRIQKNQMAIVSLEAYPGVIFVARVFEISPVLDPKTRSMTAKLKIEPFDKRVKAGMFARVKLITGSIRNAIVIPSNAIVMREGVPYVFILDDPEAERTTAVLNKIKVGITVDDMTEVTGGLEVGDVIVTKGQTLLNDGADIRVISVAED